MISRSPNTHYLLIKFLLVGGVNTVFGYNCFAVLIYWGVHYTAAVFIGTILGIGFNFVTTGTLVFGSLKFHKFMRFAAVYGLLYLVNVAWLKAMLMWGVSLYVGGATGIVPVALLGFVLNKRFVFGVNDVH